ncbi:MAG: hypothetical protein Q8Q03_03265 [bacterium]|nr:hypothetical protein [bacterium]
MSTIDADAARLAGLQIDTLTKLRGGSITLEQWEWFNLLSTEDRSRVFDYWKGLKPLSPAVPKEKFFFVKTVKVIIPKDYDHSTRLTSFHEKNRKKFYGYNSDITDENFAKVSHQLIPGKTYDVKIFGITSGEVVSSEECLIKYQAEKAYYVGAQGSSIIFEQKREELPKGKWYASFDEKDRLPFAGGYHRVPLVGARSDGGFDFDLGYFEDAWLGRHCLLCFCDEEQPSVTL